MHPHLRLVAGLIMTAGLVSACSGGSSGTGMPPPPPAERPMTVTVEEPTGCTAASPTCTEIVTTTAADGTMTRVTTVTTNVAGTNTDGTDPMTNVQTETVNGTMMTITVTSTNPAHMNRVMSVEMLTCTASEDCMRTSLREITYVGDTTTVMTTRVTMDGRVTETTDMADAEAMTNTRTVTVSGTMRTITVTSTEDGHENRVMTIERQTCTAGDNCVRSSVETRTYGDTNTPTAVLTVHYADDGETVTRRVTGTGDMARTTYEFSTMLSGSGGGRTETTVTDAGTRVQTFSQAVGGTATSTVLTVTDSATGVTTVTRTVGTGTMRTRTETVTRADGEVTRVITGAPKLIAGTMNVDPTGFTGMVTVEESFPDGRTNVGQTFTKTAGAADAAGTITHRIYVRTSDSSDRETLRETVSVSGGVDGSITESVATAYPSSGAVTKRTTTTKYAAGEVDTITVKATESTGKETTTVYSGVDVLPTGAAATTAALAAITRTTTVKDGMTTTTTYGTRYMAPTGADAAVGERHAAVTSGGLTTTTVTMLTGTGTDATRRTLRVVTRDELGIEFRRETRTENELGRTLITTDFAAAGGSTKKTELQTRTSKAATTWTRSTGAGTTYTEVRTDSMDRKVREETITGNTRTVVATEYDPETGDSTKTTTRYTRTTAAADWEQQGSAAVEMAGTVTHSDGTTTTRTELPRVTNDEVMDIWIVTRAKPAAGAPAGTLGAITRDIVMHPGVQSHAIVEDPEYTKIADGLGEATQVGTVMGQAILHLDYSVDMNSVNTETFNDAFTTFVDDGVTAPADENVKVEVELITASPTCAANGCTYNDLRHSGPGTNDIPEVRIGSLTASDGDGAGYVASLGSSADGWETDVGSRASKVVMHQLLYDLLTVSGAGVKAAYTPPTSDSTLANPGATPPVTASNDGYVAAGASAAGAARAVTGPKVVVTNAVPTADERSTFTHLKETELPDGVLGIGQQVKEVDSYTPDLLGGVRGDTPNPVEVKVENYFGWMASSMFTVRRVTAQGVTGAQYDWVSGTKTPGPTGEVRAYFGMASGDPTGHIPRERAIGDAMMTDPGTWTGTMIGVGSIRGERYRGKAQVEVDFVGNEVTTTFNEVRLAMDSAADRTANAGRLLQIAPALADLGGIAFESGVMKNDGSYTSDMLTGGTDKTGAGAVVDTNNLSSLSARFYGTDAAEVAGTFNAHGLALGYDIGSPATPTRNRGDLVGAFGAARDSLDPVAPAASGN